MNKIKVAHIYLSNSTVEERCARLVFPTNPEDGEGDIWFKEAAIHIMIGVLRSLDTDFPNDSWSQKELEKRLSSDQKTLYNYMARNCSAWAPVIQDPESQTASIALAIYYEGVSRFKLRCSQGAST